MNIQLNQNQKAGRTLQDQHGFSLVGVLVASAILGMLSLGLASLMVDMQRGMTGVAAKSGFLDLVKTVNVNLAVDKTCLDVLNGVPISLATARTPDGVEIGMNVPSVGRVAAGVELANWGVKIESVRMYGVTDVGADAAGVIQHNGLMRIKASKLNPESLGGQGMAFQELGAITFALNSGTISRCASERSPSFTCNELGGVYSTTTTPRCQLPISATSCASLGGIYNPAAVPVCQIPFSATSCTAMGGVYNAGANPPCQLPVGPAACTAMGGSYNDNASPKCTLPKTTTPVAEAPKGADCIVGGRTIPHGTVRSRQGFLGPSGGTHCAHACISGVWLAYDCMTKANENN